MYTHVDHHDLMLRDAKIQNLEEHNRELQETLHRILQVIEYYSRQHNGFVAQQLLVELEGGH